MFFTNLNLKTHQESTVWKFKSLKDFVFESHRAKLLPNLFYGIHFRGIGRKSLGMEVITEGVETGQQLATLTDMDCSHFQGYYFSKPVPV